jgi:hypothetical protein
MTSRSCCYKDSHIYVKLDISAAYDSIYHSRLFRTLQKNVGPEHATSAKFIQWLVLSQSLSFSLFGKEWTIPMRRGTIQGGVHSPWLFSYAIASMFDDLSAEWDSKGESPPFKTSSSQSIRGIWFVDDGMVVFQSLAQLRRLWPSLQEALLQLGLRINLKKSSLLCVRQGISIPPCLHGVLQVEQFVYLGLPLRISEEDDYIAESLCLRGLKAYMTNRCLFQHGKSPLAKRLYVFDRLVTACIAWAVGTLRITAPLLKLFRVQHTTFMVWLLRSGAHGSWFTAEQFTWVGRLVKAWMNAYTVRWDVMVASKVWQFAGHALRGQSWPAELIQGAVHVQSMQLGTRRHRRGPDNTHFRSVVKFVAHQGFDLEVARDREKWASLQTAWVHHHLPDVHVPFTTGPNMSVVDPEWLSFDLRAMQGVVRRGFSVFLLQHGETWCAKFISRVEGWTSFPLEVQSPPDSLMQLLLQTVSQFIHLAGPSAFHMRIYVLSDVQLCERAFPCRLSVLSSRVVPMVSHVSLGVPPEWQALVTQA